MSKVEYWFVSDASESFVLSSLVKSAFIIMDAPIMPVVYQRGRRDDRAVHELRLASGWLAGLSVDIPWNCLVVAVVLQDLFFDKSILPLIHWRVSASYLITLQDP